MNAELLEEATWAARQNALGGDYEAMAAAVLRVVVEACAQEAAQCAIAGHAVSIASIEAACRRIRALTADAPAPSPSGVP